MNKKVEGTLSMNKGTEEVKPETVETEDTKALQAERDKLQKDLDAMTGPVKEAPVEEPPREGESNLAAAARRGRERADPRFIGAAKRDPSQLDMGADFDLKMTLHDYQGQLDGFHVHWIVDRPGKIQRLLSKGYQPIYRAGIKVGDGPDDFNDNMDTWVSMITGTVEGGAPQVSYALKIDQELYDLTKARQRKERVTDVEDQIASGHFEENDGDHRYIDKSRTKFDFAR